MCTGTMRLNTRCTTGEDSLSVTAVFVVACIVHRGQHKLIVIVFKKIFSVMLIAGDCSCKKRNNSKGILDRNPPAFVVITVVAYAQMLAISTGKIIIAVGSVFYNIPCFFSSSYTQASKAFASIIKHTIRLYMPFFISL